MPFLPLKPQVCIRVLELTMRAAGDGWSAQDPLISELPGAGGFLGQQIQWPPLQTFAVDKKKEERVTCCGAASCGRGLLVSFDPGARPPNTGSAIQKG